MYFDVAVVVMLLLLLLLLADGHLLAALVPSWGSWGPWPSLYAPQMKMQTDNGRQPTTAATATATATAGSSNSNSSSAAATATAATTSATNSNIGSKRQQRLTMTSHFWRQ